MIIDNWLYHHDILHAYEKAGISEKNINDKILCDFYLKNQNIYIEYFSLENNEEYNIKKERKIELYRNDNKKLIVLKPDDLNTLEEIMEREISKLLKLK